MVMISRLNRNGIFGGCATALVGATELQGTQHSAPSLALTSAEPRTARVIQSEG